MMNKMDLMWLAGLLEGEGSFGMSKSRSHGPAYPNITVKMTDRDVIERASMLMGVGVVLEPVPGENKQPYRARVRGERACHLMVSLLPYMGQRRSARIKEILSLWGDIDRKSPRGENAQVKP